VVGAATGIALDEDDGGPRSDGVRPLHVEGFLHFPVALGVPGPGRVGAGQAGRAAVLAELREARRIGQVELAIEPGEVAGKEVGIELFNKLGSS
jgi:hypothetical protein